MSDTIPDEEAARIINEVLGRELEAYGFRGAEFTEMDLVDGTVFLDIASHVDRRVEPLDSIKALSKLRDVLLAAGERRFPNVINYHPEAA